MSKKQNIGSYKSKYIKLENSIIDTINRLKESKKNSIINNNDRVEEILESNIIVLEGILDDMNELEETEQFIRVTNLRDFRNEVDESEKEAENKG